MFHNVYNEIRSCLPSLTPFYAPSLCHHQKLDSSLPFLHLQLKILYSIISFFFFYEKRNQMKFYFFIYWKKLILNSCFPEERCLLLFINIKNKKKFAYILLLLKYGFCFLRKCFLVISLWKMTCMSLQPCHTNFIWYLLSLWHSDLSFNFSGHWNKWL